MELFKNTYICVLFLNIVVLFWGGKVLDICVSKNIFSTRDSDVHSWLWSSVLMEAVLDR